MADETPPAGGSSQSMDPKLSALLCYLLSIIGGIIFYMISKDKFVRFHAIQSIGLGVLFIVLDMIVIFVPFLWFFSWIVYLGFVALTVVMMIKAYNGEKFKLPVIGDMAEKNS